MTVGQPASGENIPNPRGRREQQLIPCPDTVTDDPPTVWQRLPSSAAGDTHSSNGAREGEKRAIKAEPKPFVVAGAVWGCPLQWCPGVALAPPCQEQESCLQHC